MSSAASLWAEKHEELAHVNLSSPTLDFFPPASCLLPVLRASCGNRDQDWFLEKGPAAGLGITTRVSPLQFCQYNREDGQLRWLWLGKDCLQGEYKQVSMPSIYSKKLWGPHWTVRVKSTQAGQGKALSSWSLKEHGLPWMFSKAGPREEVIRDCYWHEVDKLKVFKQF